MLHFGDGVELALSVDLSLDIVNLVISRLEVVLHLSQSLLYRLFVRLRIVPLYN